MKARTRQPAAQRVRHRTRQLRAQLRGLTTAQGRSRVALPAWRSVDPDRWRETCAGQPSLADGARSTPRSRNSTGRSSTILDTIAAPLLARHGVGYDTAGVLLCTAGDNPDRLATEVELRRRCVAPRPFHLERQLEPTTTQPSRRPQRRTRAVDHRDGPSPQPPRAHRRLPRTTRRRRPPKRDAIRCLKRFVAARSTSTSKHITATHTDHQHSRSPLDTKRRIRGGGARAGEEERRGARSPSGAAAPRTRDRRSARTHRRTDDRRTDAPTRGGETGTTSSDTSVQEVYGVERHDGETPVVVLDPASQPPWERRSGPRWRT